MAIIRHPRVGEYAFGFITSSVTLQVFVRCSKFSLIKKKKKKPSFLLFSEMHIFFCCCAVLNVLLMCISSFLNYWHFSKISSSYSLRWLDRDERREVERTTIIEHRKEHLIILLADICTLTHYFWMADRRRGWRIV